MARLRVASAARMFDHGFPDAPVLQFVLIFPFPLGFPPSAEPTRASALLVPPTVCRQLWIGFPIWIYIVQQVQFYAPYRGKECFMRSFLRVAAVGLVFLLLTACGSGRYTIVEPAKKQFSDYHTLEIKPFTTTLNSAEAKALSDRFAERLHRAITEQRAENPDRLVFQDITLQTAQSEGVLLVEGNVISYEEGSRAKRYFIGFGSGKAYCTIQVIFRDKNSGEEVSRTNFDGELGMGIFGGDADEAVDAVVGSFIDYMREYMSS